MHRRKKIKGEIYKIEKGQKTHETKNWLLAKNNKTDESDSLLHS